MKKVLHILLGEMHIGGVSAVVMNYYRHIDRTKIQFDFLTLHNRDKPYISPYQSEIESLGGKYIKLYTERIRYHFRFCHAIKQVLTSENYIAIHVHGSPSYSILYNIVSFYAQKYRISKRIIHSHNDIFETKTEYFSLDKIYKSLIQIFYPQKFNTFFACSDIAGKAMFKKRPFQFIKNAISLQKFKYKPDVRQAFREELHISHNIKIIGHVGIFTLKQKNQMFLIEMFSELKKINPNVFLILVGDGASRQIIEDKIKQLNLENSVMLAGLQSQVEKWYNIFDCFVLPSFHEGLPVVAIEAQTSGVPCILSDTISRDVHIMSNLHFLSLSAEKNIWAHKICEALNQNDDRLKAFKIMEESGWDIKIAAQKLETFYLST